MLSKFPKPTSTLVYSKVGISKSLNAYFKPQRIEKGCCQTPSTPTSLLWYWTLKSSSFILFHNTHLVQLLMQGQTLLCIYAWQFNEISNIWRMQRVSCCCGQWHIIAVFIFPCPSSFSLSHCNFLTSKSFNFELINVLTWVQVYFFTSKPFHLWRDLKWNALKVLIQKG